MARPLRIEYPHALYHITSRGNGRNKIFLNDKDCYTFLSVFSGVIERGKHLGLHYTTISNIIKREKEQLKQKTL